MAKDQKFGITRNFAKHLIRGGVKSIPLAGNLFDEIIFGTLEGETAQKESKKLHAKLDEIVKQIDTQEGDFAEILAGLHLQTDFNEDVRKEFAKIEQLLRDPENAPVPESFNSAFEKLAADHDWQDEKLNRIDAKVTAIFDKMLDEAGSGSGRRKKRTVRIVIPNVEFNDFDERNKTLLEHGLANFLRIEPGDISVTEVEPGSVKVTVEIPDEHVRKLVKAVSIGDSNLTDTLEPFNLKVRQVFISYNHENEDWKNKLVRHLGVLEKEGLVEVWDDRKIGAGDVWSKKIEGAINSANVAILMITAEFLTSDFILSKEVPMLLERMQKEGLRVIPLIVKPCAWKKVKWLKVIQSRPKDGKALSGMSDHEIDEALTELAEEIHRLVSKDQGRDRTERTRGRKQDFFIPKVLPAKCPPSVKHLGEKEPEVEMAEISIAIKGKYRPLSPEAMSEIISTFSKEMGGVVGEIRVLYTMPGRSMRITMAVPREYAERVRSLCTEKSPTLKKLGVKGVEVRTIASVVKVAFPKYWPTPEAFVGRERELASLDDAWGGECDVFMLVAWGGVGKTALVNEWMNRMAEGNWHGARRVYGWSFYSQGTKKDRQASGDRFISEALKWFGDSEMATSAQSPWDKGMQLAELICQERTLLVLDGLEPLQYSPGPMQGGLKDPGLQALLRGLCRGMNGLCVVTTREAVEDIKGFVNHSVQRVDLENLSPKAGAGVLRSKGIKGTDRQLEKASVEFGGHALTLTLLGNYLTTVHDGDVRKRDLVERLYDDETQGGHARNVMASYEILLRGTAEFDILNLMGLFDRPAEIGAINALRKKPAIMGLTENLVSLEKSRWKYAIHHLQELRLLESGGTNVLDSHPLIREHFGEKLEKEKADAWRKGHERLYEYYKGLPEKELPDTLEEMEPLFRAVYHGCQAGREQETLDEVYWERISRENDFYSTNKLGAFGSDLGAVACFFERCWDRPAAGLKEHDKAGVLNWAGFMLRAVGRLRESAEVMRAAVKNFVKQDNWKEAAANESNLSEIWLVMGEVGKAVDYGRESVEYADRSGDWGQEMTKRTALADALHQAGDTEGAEKLFREAEGMQRERQPGYEYLYGVAGYQFCDLLLGQGRYGEVKERASKTLEWFEQAGLDILSTALDNVSLGRAHLLEYQELKTRSKKDNDESKKALAEAKKWLEGAVAGLREAGAQHRLPHGLLARAGLGRVMGEYGKAEADLAEAREIAERGEMGLYLADCGLEGCRLGLAQGDRPRAESELARAEGLIEEMGYHRRDGEVGELRDKIGGRGSV